MKNIAYTLRKGHAPAPSALLQLACPSDACHRCYVSVGDQSYGTGKHGSWLGLLEGGRRVNDTLDENMLNMFYFDISAGCRQRLHFGDIFWQKGLYREATQYLLYPMRNFFAVVLVS